ncbi:MAG: cell division protein FtsZ [Bryobacteraceae bacterium]
MALMDTDLDSLKYEIEEEARSGTQIKVIGVGGAGSNAVARMVAEGLGGVEFYAMDTDHQALAACSVPNKVQLGAKITRGLGAGSKPEVGRQAALENTDQIVELLQGADMVFVTAGLGYGTGTGAAPVVANLAKELGALTVAVVTKPFAFEGAMRMRLAEGGLAQLASALDAVIAIPNERLRALVPKGVSFFEAFKVADDLLRQAVQGISDIINTPGVINRDFSDIRSVMAGMGYAMMGTATGRGENAAVEAARAAISCPLLEGVQITGSRGILINVTGSRQMSFQDVDDACNLIREATHCDAVEITFGAILDEKMADEVKVTVIATGFQPDGAVVAESPRQVVQAVAPPVIAAPEPEPLPMPVRIPEPVMEPDPVMPEPALLSDADPVIDLDDLDTPAYLRQGRLLN